MRGRCRGLQPDDGIRGPHLPLRSSNTLSDPSMAILWPTLSGVSVMSRARSTVLRPPAAALCSAATSSWGLMAVNVAAHTLCRQSSSSAAAAARPRLFLIAGNAGAWLVVAGKDWLCVPSPAASGPMRQSFPPPAQRGGAAGPRSVPVKSTPVLTHHGLYNPTHKTRTPLTLWFTSHQGRDQGGSAAAGGGKAPSRRPPDASPRRRLPRPLPRLPRGLQLLAHKRGLEPLPLPRLGRLPRLPRRRRTLSVHCRLVDDFSEELRQGCSRGELGCMW